MSSVFSQAVPEICVYHTNGSCQILTQIALKYVKEKYDLPEFSITAVKPNEIIDGYLDQKHVVGLIMPGRDKGMDYRNELKNPGFEKIHKAYTEGLFIHGTCAAAHVLSAYVDWNNKFAKESWLIATSETPIFKGFSKGLIYDLCNDPYLMAKQDKFGNFVPVNYDEIAFVKGEPSHTNADIYLPASVVHVSFADKKDQTFSVVYNGGGTFGSYEEHHAKPLFYHEDTNSREPAAIALQEGDGLAWLLNIHPEVTANQFNFVFRNSPKAARDPALFTDYFKALQASEETRMAHFYDFARECLHNGKMNHSQPLIISAPGLL